MRPKVPEPMDLAASIFPSSTLASAVSTCLEKNGTVPKTNGIIAPFTPIAVFTIALVKGMRKISKMTKGMALNTFTNASRMRNTTLFSFIPPLRVIVRITPNSIPRKKEITPGIINKRQFSLTLWPNLALYAQRFGAIFSIMSDTWNLLNSDI